MHRIDRWVIRDKSSVICNSQLSPVIEHCSRNPQNVWIRVFDDVSKIVNDVLKNGAQLAIVARTNKSL